MTKQLSHREYLKATNVQGVADEVLDLTPLEQPDHMRHGATLEEDIARYVRFQISEYASTQGWETIEEANEFPDEDPEEDWASQYQFAEMELEEIVGAGEESPAPTPEADSGSDGDEEAAPAADGSPPVSPESPQPLAEPSSGSEPPS